MLKYDDFMLEFKIMWDRAVQTQEKYCDVAQWWEEYTKPLIKMLCVRMSAMVARGRRGLKEYMMMVLEQSLKKKDWVEVAIARGRLRDIMREECLGFKVRSKYKENIEREKASLFHVAEKKRKLDKEQFQLFYSEMQK